MAPDGAPSILYIVLDDVGFSAMEPWGGLIETPNINRLAKQGLTYTNWHTTALCSPTRSSLLTGRNHTTNGMACIAEATGPFPGINGHIPFESATIAEVLGERGWNTYMLGKWHLVAADEMNMASTKRNWPVGRGFERYYGFLGGETNQWYPDLVYDNHLEEQPRLPSSPAEWAEGKVNYHLTEDLTDRAIGFIRDSKVVAPEKPFFMYFCPGACHAPHHAPKDWIDKYKGKFDMGYDKYRELVFDRQKKMGIMPDDAVLSPANPYINEKSHDGKPWNPVDVTRPWDSLSADEKALFARMAEVYAGFLSHVDHHIGRLLDYLEETGQLDNTIVVLVSDNGASGEGGPNGSVNENKFFNGVPDQIEDNLPFLDKLGSPETYNHYPTGWAWAFNTPFKMWKRYNFEGGIADPLVISWPKGIKAHGEIRHQYNHATDIVPTIYDCLGIELPDEVKGFTQIPLEGPELPLQLRGRRCADREGDRLLHDARLAGHLAQGLEGRCGPSDHRRMGRLRERSLGVVRHDQGPDRDDRPGRPVPGEGPGTREPVVLAGRHVQGPADRRPDPGRDHQQPASPDVASRATATSTTRTAPRCPEQSSVNIRSRSYTIAAEVTIDTPEAAGVLFSHGARFGGHSLYIKDGKLKYAYNFVRPVRPGGRVRRRRPDRQAHPVGSLRPRGHGHAGARHGDAVHR